MPTVGSSMYDRGGRKYIIIDSLEIKVPWRYGRIIGVSHIGLKTVHELVAGDTINRFTFSKRTWEGDTYRVLRSIDTRSPLRHDQERAYS